MKSTVLIPTKNAGDELREVLQKVLDQKTDFDFEVVIIDSGSKDNTIEIIQDLQKKYVNLRLIEISPEEFGHGKTRNLGVKNSKGEFVALITQDSLPVDENWLQNIVKVFGKDQKIALAFGKHVPYEETYPVEKKQIIDHFEKGFGTKELIFEIKDKKDYVKRQGWYIFSSNNNACIRKSIWEKTPFQEVRMGEDQFWAKDILEAGYKKIYVPNAQVYHSHKYSFKEIIKRYYDEYRFHADVGNLPNATKKSAIKFYLKSLKQSEAIVLRSNLNFFQKIYFVFFYIIYDVARTYGYYIGTNGSDLKDKKFSMQTEKIRE